MQQTAHAHERETRNTTDLFVVDAHQTRPRWPTAQTEIGSGDPVMADGDGWTGGLSTAESFEELVEALASALQEGHVQDATALLSQADRVALFVEGAANRARHRKVLQSWRR